MMPQDRIMHLHLPEIQSGKLTPIHTSLTSPPERLLMSGRKSKTIFSELSPSEAGWNYPGLRTVSASREVRISSRSNFVQAAPHRLSFRIIKHRIAWAIACWLFGEMFSLAQSLPIINAGSDSGFQQIDFAQIYLDTQSRDLKKREELKLQNQELVDSGLISVLDLAAPNKDVKQYNLATTLLRAQK